MRTRAERRALRVRNLRRWLRIIRSWGGDYSPSWVFFNARKYAGHGKLCSCPACGNRRKAEGPTLQERRAQEDVQ